MERQKKEGQNMCAKMAAIVLTITVLSSKFITVAALTFSRDHTSLNHMVMNQDNGELYIGAVNNIYRLNPDLQLQSRTETGPELDNPKCTDFSSIWDKCISPKNVQIKMIDNHNKLLVIDKEGGKLLSCGSIYQGTCEMRDLNELNQLTDYHSVNDVDVTLAPNTDEDQYSVVSFISSGPVCDSDGVATGTQNVLYVGASNTNGPQAKDKSTIRQNIPLVGSHSLKDPKLDTIFKDPFTNKAASIVLKNAYSEKESNLIQFKAGFATGGFSYFLTIQPEFDGATKYMSKIIQICQSDCFYRSFIEIPILCTHQGNTYNLVQSAKLVKPGSKLAADLKISTNEEVLIGIFSENNQGYTPGANSAVCMFTLKDINLKIKENMQNCFNGQGSLASQFKGTFSQLCSTSGQSVTDGYCHKGSTNTPISGSQPLTKTCELHYTGVQLTSIEVDVIEEFTVGFLGTSTGRLKRALLRMGTYATEYKEDVIEDGAAILQDMLLSKDRNYIYVMTKNKLHRVAITDCSSASNCTECQALKNPYCGWCSLQNKCSERRHCDNYTQDKRWQSIEEPCIALDNKVPKNVSIISPANINMTVKNLPPNQQYECIFDNDSYKTLAVVTSQNPNVYCPPPDPRPPIEPGNDSVSLTLYLKSVETEVQFLSQRVDFYDCSVHSTCSGCASARWNCHWCVHDNACVDTSSCPRADSDSVSHPAWCPRVVQIMENKILPHGVQKDIILSGVNFPVPKSDQSGYQCWVTIGNEIIKVPAERKDHETVECQAKDYTTNSQAEVSAAVDIIWNNQFMVENPQDTSLVTATVYSCSLLGPDCSSCINLETTHNNYNCKFCSSQCSYGPSCSTPVTINCPPPNINTVTPLSGPIQGGTLLTITGVNLGTKFAEVENAVTIDELVCVAIKDRYVVSTEIVCRTSASQVVKNGTIYVSLTKSNNDGTHVTYHKLFQYKDPQPKRATPLLGPVSGGTKVTIEGAQLKTGAQIGVKIGAANCAIKNMTTEVTDDRIICTTEASTTVQSDLGFEITFDETTHPLTTKYSYKPDPTVTNITPLESYLAGGRQITVMGTGLNVIQKPLIFFNTVDNRGNCTVRSPTLMNCSSPVIKPSTNGRKRRQTAGDYVVGFIMDGVKHVRNLDQNENVTSTVAVFTNPFYAPFKDGKYQYKGDPTLELSGTNLDRASKKNEVRVFIGTELCPVTTLSTTSLYCKPPSKQPAGEGQGKLPKVKVTVANMEFSIGTIEYVGDQSNEGWIIGVAIGGGVLLTLIIIILVVYKRKSTRAERQYKKLKVQLDTLESNVRNECKQGIETSEPSANSDNAIAAWLLFRTPLIRRSQLTVEALGGKAVATRLAELKVKLVTRCNGAYQGQASVITQSFAELQTEVSDFTSDISVIGIPIWDYKTYTFKVLFPGHQDHPVLHNGPEFTNKFGGYDQGLHQFSQLLNSKHFMLIFIRTLEQQKNFGVRDKAVVASLLMIVLQDKMEYATDILRALMNELIDRSVEKKHPKLMLRRTESVVEKLLTNWLSICMYSYLKKHAGKELFMLYQAIKRQTEKGPVDAISSEARYSLSEDRLLRDKIEPKTLTLNLVTDGEREPVTCKALDCDTITQAKQKALDAIYLNTPFSHRPSVYDIDLEWRSGKSGHLPLQDEDVTTEVVHGWKKVNTLLHYHVPDGAVMALVQKRYKTDGVRTVHGRIEITGSHGMQPIVTMEDGQKVWHLLKHDDGVYISRQQKVISEIFLTRLLATKGTLQQYIDELFSAILRVDTNLPPAIKWLFDFLDGAARRHGIHDPDVVHTWKSNSLPLRFWVNIIKNPEFVFDIHKSNIADSCLSVIAQTFMDSCSTMEHRLGKDSPSNKLLFAKDIPKYRGWVSKFYRGIQEMAPVTDIDMNQKMTEMSLNFLLKHYTAEFNVSIALKELFKYAHQYNFELLEALDEDPSARKFHLANKFEEVTANLEGNY